MIRNKSNRLQAFKNFLLFALYISVLLGVAWYNFQYHNGAYNTIITDLLLTTSFSVAYFIPMMMPQLSKKSIYCITAMFFAAALLLLFVLTPFV